MIIVFFFVCVCVCVCVKVCSSIGGTRFLHCGGVGGNNGDIIFDETCPCIFGISFFKISCWHLLSFEFLLLQALKSQTIKLPFSQASAQVSDGSPLVVIFCFQHDPAALHA